MNRLVELYEHCAARYPFGTIGITYVVLLILIFGLVGLLDVIL